MKEKLSSLLWGLFFFLTIEKKRLQILGKELLCSLWILLLFLTSLDVFLTIFGIELGVITEDNPATDMFIGNGVPAIFIFKYFIAFSLLAGVVLSKEKTDIIILTVLIVVAIGVFLFFNLKHLQWVLPFFS